MAKIGLIDGWRDLRIGDDQLLYIKKATYDDKFMVAKLTFEDADGRTHTEQYKLKGKTKGTMNEGALAALSIVAKCATKDQRNREIDPTALAGLFIRANVVKDVNQETGRSYIHIRGIEETDDEFEPRDDAEAVEEASEEEEGAGEDDFDLDDLLA